MDERLEEMNFSEPSNDLLSKPNETREKKVEAVMIFKTCPIDQTHKVSLKHYEKHVERCTTNQKRPERKDEMELTGEPDGRIPSVKIDKNLQFEIIKSALGKNPAMRTGVPIEKLQDRELPRYHSDIQIDFSREEKLALYEYAVEQTGHHPEPEIKIPFNEDGTGNKKSMTFAEIVAFKRDIKRRRMKYRTTKEPPLSRTEEVRRLIDTQMKALEQYLKPEEKSPEKLGSSSRDDCSSHQKRFRMEEGRISSSSANYKRLKRSRSRSRNETYERKLKSSSSKSSHRRKSSSPSSSRSRRNGRGSRSRSRSRDRRDRSTKREHKKSKHKKRDRSKSRSRNRHCDYEKNTK